MVDDRFSYLNTVFSFGFYFFLNLGVRLVTRSRPDNNCTNNKITRLNGTNVVNRRQTTRLTRHMNDKNGARQPFHFVPPVMNAKRTPVKNGVRGNDAFSPSTPRVKLSGGRVRDEIARCHPSPRVRFARFLWHVDAVSAVDNWEPAVTFSLLTVLRDNRRSFLRPRSTSLGLMSETYRALADRFGVRTTVSVRRFKNERKFRVDERFPIVANAPLFGKMAVFENSRTT